METKASLTMPWVVTVGGGIHWHMWQENGVTFCQLRGRERKACSGPKHSSVYMREGDAWTTIPADEVDREKVPAGECCGVRK